MPPAMRPRLDALLCALGCTAMVLSFAWVAWHKLEDAAWRRQHSCVAWQDIEAAERLARQGMPRVER